MLTPFTCLTFDFAVVQPLTWIFHTIFSGFVPPRWSGGERDIDPVTLRHVTLPVATVTLDFGAADARAPARLEKNNTIKSTTRIPASLDFDLGPPMA